MFSNAVEANDIGKACVIGDEHICRIVFDMICAGYFQIPKWIDPDDGLTPEVSNSMGHSFVSVKWLEEYNHGEYK